MKKRAYVSVFDKENIIDFARKLNENDYEIVSTGGTFELLKKNGIDAIEVSEVTGYSEMLSGKVKSLHPAIFGGILADMTNPAEAREVELNNLQSFDMVVVNLYPFEQVASKTNDIEELIANIDIGGVSLLRAGAKNYKNVTVVNDIKDYDRAINANEQVRQDFAIKAFKVTSNYDNAISEKLEEVFGGYKI